MKSENTQTDDLRDRMLDRALREVVGQETPPDLSEQIMFAATGEKSQQLNSLATADKPMTTEPMSRGHRRAILKRRLSVALSLAASLLLAAGLILPTIKTTYESEGYRIDSVAKKEKDVEYDALTELVTSTVEPEVWSKEAGKQTTVELPDFETVPVQSTVTVPDNGTVIFGGQERLVESNRKPTDSKSNLMLGVTPRIITQEQEENEHITENLAFAANAPSSMALSPAPRNRSKQAGTTTFAMAKKKALSSGRYYLFGDFDRLGLALGSDHGGVDGRLHWGFESNGRRWAEGGRGPDTAGDKYTRIYENPFIAAEGERAVSTFSIDVDTASYANMRQFLMQLGQLPPLDAVRIEELVNYFDYDYSAPTSGDTPFAPHVEVAGCPWQAEHRLVRVGIKGREIATDQRPQSNLVFLIDVSGSMNDSAKLPLLVDGMKMLTRELGENDRVAIVVYASSEGLALPSTRGDQQDTILAALDKLRAGGSTAGGAGIQLAYKIAKENYIEGGVNRVILATDGDFNVGTTSTADLERLAETNAKETGVFLTVLGFGRGNLNDAMMEAISGKGNGNYHYVDNQTEARKVLVAEMAGTLVTIAKDVKIQIEFNPSQVAAYRLIGYENRVLATQDFNDDKKDAGEIGAGHTVTAIYEVVPAGKSIDTSAVDPLKYQKPAQKTVEGPQSGELLTLKIRYKQPDGDKSTKLEFPISDNGQPFAKATSDFKFASAVASFGMLLRNSEHQGNASYGGVEEIAQDGLGKDKHGYRAEFLQLVRQARVLAGE